MQQNLHNKSQQESITKKKRVKFEEAKKRNKQFYAMKCPHRVQRNLACVEVEDIPSGDKMMQN